MSTKDWIFIRNPFFNVTKKNYLKCLNLSISHDSALNGAKGDPDILILYNRYHPKHLEFTVAYNNWQTSESEQQSRTFVVEELFQKLSGELAPKWDVNIQNVYPLSSAAYIRLLPNRRKPFQNGKQAERLQALEGLSTNIGTDTALTTVKTEIDAFIVQLKTAMSDQRSYFTTTKNNSVKVEAARAELCNLMYANLGALMQKFANAPKTAENFFDMKLVRSGEQTYFTGTVKPLQRITVVKRTFNAGDEVILSNPTNATLKFYLAKLKDDLPGTKFVELPKGEQTISAEQLGNISDPFLMVMNTNGDIWGKYEVEII